jgi:hypothetical protein
MAESYLGWIITIVVQVSIGLGLSRDRYPGNHHYERGEDKCRANAK